MKLGDFFVSAPHSRPVNPRSISFTAVARGSILPGGSPNPHKRPVAATVTGALIFIGGDGIQSARVAARRRITEIAQPDPKVAPVDLGEGDFELELTYQVVWRALYEYDAKENEIGARLFPTVDDLREFVEVREANRLFRAYTDYVAEEHPEGVDATTFRGAQSGGPRLAAKVSG